MLIAFVACSMAVGLVGGSSFWLTRECCRTYFATTNTSANFGMPRGGLLATMASGLLGVFLFAYIFPAAIAAITALITGTLGGIAGVLATILNHKKKRDK